MCSLLAQPSHQTSCWGATLLQLQQSRCNSCCVCPRNQNTTQKSCCQHPHTTTKKSHRPCSAAAFTTAHAFIIKQPSPLFLVCNLQLLYSAYADASSCKLSLTSSSISSTSSTNTTVPGQSCKRRKRGATTNTLAPAQRRCP